jgi:hypothetical protein
MKQSVWVVSCLSLGLGALAVGCSPTSHSGGAAASSGSEYGAADGFASDGGSVAQPRLRGAAVGNFNKGYVDGINAAAFFNKGQPLSDDQVDRLIEIGRRQGDPTGLLALQGYPEGYRTGAKHTHNPYQKEMTPEQVAHVNKALGLPEPVQPTATARATETKQPVAKEQKKSKRSAGKGTAEASARD